eukprot:UN22769
MCSFIFSKEMLSLITQFLLLVTRSLISVRITNAFGQMLQAVSNRKINKFTKTMIGFMLSGILAAFVNSCLKHMDNAITLYFRKRLTRKVHGLYLLNRNYYQLSSSTKIDNPDQRITQDIQQFCKSFSDPYSHT